MSLSEGIRALNLGCGTAAIFGDGCWINIDNSPNARLSKYPWLKWALWKAGVLSDSHYNTKWDRSVVIADLSKKLRYPDSSVDYVYSSHCLEHLSQSDARSLMGEIYRVLKPGGIVRIVVPDLEYGARRYIEAIQANPSDPEAAPKLLTWLELSKEDGSRVPHLWMYDAPSLGKLLAGTGFVNVMPCEYRKGRLRDCETLDSRPVASVHVEGEKPGGAR